ncbi:MAG: GntR family transcriptional regulator [Rhizobiaceae bacterium]|nr:GntR family transcriptional regulator [Rhizobiaceae bacterium]
MAQTARSAGFAYRPLYAQVRESLVRRLIEGSWQPGQLIPSEVDLARELGVSQGTIRKALDVMTAEKLLIRRQGRGTFVAAPEESRILFQFFRLVPDQGEPTFPESRVLRVDRDVATAAERADLELSEAAPVIRIERVRTLAGRPAIVETITLSAERFAGFEALPGVPNNVYRLYSERWGITIAGASEKLKAGAATPADAGELSCAPGTPLLEIHRVAHDLEDRPVELRVSRCLTATLHYSSDLR